jgi:biopolymer transport protein ExbD
MTPLVDVVMVILIFLMLTGTFAGATHYLQANMPPVGKAATVDPGGGPARIEIRVQGNSDQMFAYVGNSPAISDEDRLFSTLKALGDSLKGQGKKPDDIQVIIFPGKFVKYQTLVRVYGAAIRAELPKIAFGNAH